MKKKDYFISIDMSKELAMVDANNPNPTKDWHGFTIEVSGNEKRELPLFTKADVLTGIGFFIAYRSIITL